MCLNSDVIAKHVSDSCRIPNIESLNIIEAFLTFVKTNVREELFVLMRINGFGELYTKRNMFAPNELMFTSKRQPSVYKHMEVPCLHPSKSVSESICINYGFVESKVERVIGYMFGLIVSSLETTDSVSVCNLGTFKKVVARNGKVKIMFKQSI